MAQEKAYKDQFSVEEVSEIAKIVNRYYQEVAITKISGTCPYGHKEGEKFRVTSVNHDGLCGALYQAIHPCIASMHYGGGVVLGKGYQCRRRGVPGNGKGSGGGETF